MPEIVPIKELRNTNEISRRCHESQEPIFVTKQGYGDLVVMSMETYDRLTGIADVDQSIKHAEEELAAGVSCAMPKVR
jgi:prevent-host-death family protein